jgi:hypothetical protein
MLRFSSVVRSDVHNWTDIQAARKSLGTLTTRTELSALPETSRLEVGLKRRVVDGNSWALRIVSTRATSLKTLNHIIPGAHKGDTYAESFCVRQPNGVIRTSVS